MQYPSWPGQFVPNQVPVTFYGVPRGYPAPPHPAARPRWPYRRLRRHRHEVSLYSPLMLEPVSPATPKATSTQWTKRHEAYAATVGVLWISAVCDDGAAKPPTRTELCMTLAQELNCSPDFVVRNCRWLTCPEECWRPRKTSRLVPPLDVSKKTKLPHSAALLPAKKHHSSSSLVQPPRLPTHSPIPPPLPPAFSDRDAPQQQPRDDLADLAAADFFDAPLVNEDDTFSLLADLDAQL